ncbi:MAG: PEP-CTERM sorting domain-containing protein [Gemmatimonadales bacterium]
MLKSRTLGLAAVLACAIAGTARADGVIVPPDTYCGGTDFATCASVSASYTGTGSGPFVITIVVTNLGTLGENYKSVGLWGLPIVGNDNETSASSNASFTPNAGTSALYGVLDPNDLSGSGATNATRGFGATPPPSTNGLGNGEGGTFVFTISFTGFNESAFANVGVSIRGIAPAGSDCSTRLVIQPGGTGTNNSGPFDPSCGETVIPEPITMTLLGTGLVGMGGASLLRRRRKDEELV